MKSTIDRHPDRPAIESGLARRVALRKLGNPNDPSTFTVTMKAPTDCSYVNLMSGRGVPVPADRLVAMTPEDSKPLLAIGWAKLSAVVT